MYVFNENNHSATQKLVELLAKSDNNMNNNNIT